MADRKYSAYELRSLKESELQLWTVHSIVRGQKSNNQSNRNYICREKFIREWYKKHPYVQASNT